MLFHEIYSCYYRCVEKIIEQALDHTLTQDQILEIIHQYAFEESHLQIIPALESNKWPLIDDSYHTPIKHKPMQPITLLEKQWLKAISLDPKMQLFDIDFKDLDTIEPLFTSEDFIIYDQYNNGDPYNDPHYQYVFSTLLKAIHNKKIVSLRYLGKDITCVPFHIEYSLKDDKMRLLTEFRIFNLSKIENIQILDTSYDSIQPSFSSQNNFTLEIYNQRNALERVMTHFSDLKKESEKINDYCYRVKIYYEKEDETEMIIRVLSFGPLVKVIEPVSFVNLIRQRLKMQKSCGLR